VNEHGLVGLDPTAEALNELAKTLWALAYLVPLLSVTVLQSPLRWYRRPGRQPEGQQVQREAGPRQA